MNGMRFWFCIATVGVANWATRSFWDNVVY